MDLTAQLAGLRERTRQPALSAAVAVAGEIIWADAVGNADPLGPARAPEADTQFRIASITKPQVAIAVLALVDAGALDLDRPVSTWLPDAPGGGATVAHFLSHSSGLPAEPSGPWWERAGGPSWDALVAMRLPLLARPGTRFHYSNVGYGVLGRLVETVTGRAWDAALADLVWRPLGMTRTARTPAPGHAVGVAVHPDAGLVHPEPVPGYLALGAAGELWSTPTDLVRLASFLAGVGVGCGVLRPATLALMRQPVAFADVADAPWVGAYGLGVAVGNIAGRRTHGHTGSVPGFTGELLFDPATGCVAAACGNATHPFGGALPLLDAVRSDRPAAAPVAVAPEIAALAGRWCWGSRVHELSVTPEGRLRLDSADGHGAGLFARDADGWVGVGGDYFHGERLRLVRDADAPGGVRALDIGTFCFTRTPYDPDADLPGGADPAGWRPPS